MSKNNFNGKAIYNPSGKAGEYSYWACNFYVGCSNMCEYCYCKKGFSAMLWGWINLSLKSALKMKPRLWSALKRAYAECIGDRKAWAVL